MKRSLQTCLWYVVFTGMVMHAEAQGTAFTYQGRLNANGVPVNGIYDVRVSVWSAASGASQIGNTQTNLGVTVSNGLFTVVLEFGAGVFTGPAGWLEIGVRSNGLGAFTTLTPRQPITAAPYAIFAANTGDGGSNVWQANGNSAYYNNGNVGVGTADPASKLTMRTDAGEYGVEHTDGARRLSTYVAGMGGWLGGFLAVAFDRVRFAAKRRSQDRNLGCAD